jgi:hypothetical protein
MSTIIDAMLPSFVGGEFSPNLQVRVDLQKYATGLKKAKNFIIHQTGGASNRAGTMYVAEVKYSAKKTRVIEFEYSLDYSYVLEFGEYYIRFYTSAGQITKSSASNWVTSTAYDLCDYVTYSSSRYYCKTAHTSGTFATDWAGGKWVAQSGTIYEIPTPWNENDLEDIKFAHSGDKLYLVHPLYQPRILTKYDSADWYIEEFANEYGPLMPMNDNENSTITPSAVYGSITLTASKDIFSADQIGSIWKITHAKASDFRTITWTDTNIGYLASGVACGKTWRVNSHGQWEGKIEIQKDFTGDLGATRTPIRTFSSKVSGTAPNLQGDYNANLYGDVDEFCYIRVEMKEHPISSTVTCDINCDEYDHHGYVEITGFTNSKLVTATVLSQLGNITATSEWSEGSWSTKNGFPSAVIFYQDRLVFGSTVKEPQTVWASNTSDYTNFKMNDPILDTDSISTNLTSRTLNNITTMAALQKIVALTTATEWTVGPGQDGIMSPTSLETACHANRGAANIDPIVIGNRILYVQSMGQVIRDIGFSTEAMGLQGENISIFSSHLFAGYEIVDMTYQQDPDSILWAVRSDGKLLSLTYLKEHEVFGWTWHETNDGDDLFESICSIPNSTDGIDQVWFVVKRGNKRFIEYMTKRQSTTEPEDQFFVDCGITHSGTKVTTVTGLSHLEGKEVSILGDGNVYPRQTVASGQITISPAATKVHVGLPYTSDLHTLSIELQGQGTMQGKQTRIPEAIIQFLNSRGGSFGYDEYHLDEITQRTTELYGDPIALFTGKRKLTLPSDWEIGGSVFIRQTDPLPLTILSILPRLVVGG